MRSAGEQLEAYVIAMKDCRKKIIMNRGEFYQSVIKRGYSPDIDWGLAYSAYIKLATVKT